jgi:uncharacterized protein (DUF2252 family)
MISVNRRICVGACLVTLSICVAGLPPPDAPSGAKEDPSATLKRIMELNPFLLPDDSLQLPMKLHSLLDNEQNFFGGTADLFYAWCSDHCKDWVTDRDAWVLLHGDVHIGNLGTYRLRADGPPQMKFSVVDLDEAVEAPFQLDLLRAAVSLRFLARKNKIETDEQVWRGVIEALCHRYRDALDGKPKGELDDFPAVRQLLQKGRSVDARRWLSDYCDGQPPIRFRPLRMKDGRVSDLMTPLDQAQREELIVALWATLARDAGRSLPKPLQFLNQAELRQAVLDAVQWTRVDSAGSQGLRKFLVLVNPVERVIATPSQDTRLPIMIELKEEPAPALARAGLAPSPGGEPRAQVVAEAHGQLLDPPPWLVGYAGMKQRGYLVRVKEGRSKELPGKSFASPAKLLQAAEIMGTAVGLAHRRAALSAPSGQTRVETLLKLQSDPLAEKLTVRSAAAEKELLRQYQELREDPAAKRYAARAQALLKTAKKPD